MINVQHLKFAHENFSEKHEFKVGDIVQWKPGMRLRSAAGPFVITQVLDAPRPTKDDTGSIFAPEILDIVTGFIDPELDGRFVEILSGSRRFEPYTGE